MRSIEVFMSNKKCKFLDVPFVPYKEALVSILPVPFEMTTSYVKGTGKAPAAIIDASRYVETYDIELDCSPFNIGLFCLETLKFKNKNIKKGIKLIETAVSKEIKNKHLPFVLGGEHSLSAGVYYGISSVFKDVGVVHFDAHSDLRAQYEDQAFSHASALRRIRDLTNNTLSVGIRSMCEEEISYIRENNVKIVYAHEFKNSREAFQKYQAYLRELPEKIFITFDVDVFDPAVLPDTGTPEPGGLFWDQCVDLIKEIFEQKTVVCVDFVELIPGKISKNSDFTIAKLINKVLGFALVYGAKEKFEKLY